MRRKLVSVVVLCAVALGLASCTATPRVTHTASSAVFHRADGSLGLVNVWRVSDAQGVDDRTWISFDHGGFYLWTDNGLSEGSWQGADGHFLADRAYGFSSSKRPVTARTAPWLAAATGYRKAAGGYELTDAGGTAVAQLTINGTPPKGENYIDSLRHKPVLDTQQAAGLRDPVPLPSHVVPATAATLAGRWIPSNHASHATRAYLDFAVDGVWAGTDSCNPQGGVWSVNAGGLILSTASANGLVGCTGAVGMPEWLWFAGRVGTVGDTLQFFDRTGKLLGTAVRG